MCVLNKQYNKVMFFSIIGIYEHILYINYFSLSLSVCNYIHISGYGLPCHQALHPQRPGYSKHSGGEWDEGENRRLWPDKGAAAGQRVLHCERARGKPHLLVRNTHTHTHTHTHTLHVRIRCSSRYFHIFAGWLLNVFDCCGKYCNPLWLICKYRR